MIFYSRELSQKLQDMGCVSESEHYWHDFGMPDLDPTNEPKHQWEIMHESVVGQSGLHGFSPIDFCGPSEICHKNAAIRWGKKPVCVGCGIDAVEGNLHEYNCIWGNSYQCNFSIDAYKYHRHKIIDLPEEEQEAFMWKGLK